MLKILYKKDSKGKIRIWKGETQQSLLLQYSGLLDGKLIKHQKECTPKNVGKSNATTAERQAVLELESLILDKLTHGFHETIEAAKNNSNILPMLAKNFEDEKHKIDWNQNVFVQPKLDGMRCLAIINDGNITLKSRDGKIIENMHHILDELSQIKTTPIILDGELYAHNCTFQENMKYIKKYRQDLTELIKFHVFDVVDENLAFVDRIKFAQDTIRDFNHCQVVETWKISNEDEMLNWYKIFIADNFEGAIIRHSANKYEINKRSDSLLKYKNFKDLAAKIIDIVPNEIDITHGTPVCVFNDKTFKCGVKLSHDERKKLLTDKEKYIGKIAEIRFFQFTDDNLPRFPVLYGFRNEL